uniref:Tic20 family protein Ycf60 n=1 Tax=Polysiphonia sertularioides TaxID=945028 RepID=A0A1Z1M8X4_9FLOR|nr:hypothetical protein [Polysiphonia sertularioides]ARW62419.1 hypothetical protein [Polysiphonia sertularioides]
MFTYFLYFVFSLVLLLFFVLCCYRLYLILLKNYNDNSRGVTLLDRLASVFPYGLPLMEGLQNFGQQVLPDYPFSLMTLYKKTFMPLVIFYVTHPALAFITFFVLYYFFVRSKSPIPNRPFIRFNVLQSILLFLINSLLGSAFRALPIEFRVSLYGLMLCNTLFWFVLSTIAYAVFKALYGKYANIPVISQAVKIQIDTP